MATRVPDEAEEWMFQFGLINQEGDLVPYEDAAALQNLMVQWAEERGYGIGGGFRAGTGKVELFPLREED